MLRRTWPFGGLLYHVGAQQNRSGYGKTERLECDVETGLLDKTPRDLDRHRREIEPGGDGPASREAERVAPNMALQMEHALSGNITEFDELSLGRGDATLLHVCETGAVGSRQ